MTAKTTSIHIRMTPTEYDALQTIATLERLNISELIRQLIRNEAGRQGLWPVGDSEVQRSENRNG